MKINNIELGKDKNQNPMKILTVGNNKVFVNSKYEKAVFEALKEDSDIEIVKVGDFWKVMPESLGLKETPRAFPSRSGQIKEAMQRKDASITQHQQAKEESMAIMASMRDAVLIVTTFYKDKNISEQEIENKIIQWRKTLYELLQQPFI